MGERGMQSGRFILLFDEVSEGDTCLVGGKGLRLAEMAKAGVASSPAG